MLLYNTICDAILLRDKFKKNWPGKTLFKNSRVFSFQAGTWFCWIGSFGLDASSFDTLEFVVAHDE